MSDLIFFLPGKLDTGHIWHDHVRDNQIKCIRIGNEAAGEIRTQFDIPVVFLTAHTDEDKLERAKLIYPFGFILKPFYDRELKVTIEMAISPLRSRMIIQMDSIWPPKNLNNTRGYS